MSAMTCIISHLNISGRIKSKPTRKEDYSRWQESDLQSNKRFEQISVLLVHQLMDKKYSSSSRSSCTSSICMSQVVHKDGMMSKLWLVKIVKECVLKSCLGRDALCRVDLQHALQFKFHPFKLWYSQFSHLISSLTHHCKSHGPHSNTNSWTCRSSLQKRECNLQKGDWHPADLGQAQLLKCFEVASGDSHASL